jgi:hypothetical protein
MRVVNSADATLKILPPLLHRMGLLLKPFKARVAAILRPFRSWFRISDFTVCLMGAFLGLGLGLILLRGFVFSPGVATFWDFAWPYSSHMYPMHYLWNEFNQSPLLVNTTLGLQWVYLFPAEIAQRLLFVFLFIVMGLSMFFATFKLTAPRHTTARIPLIASTLATLFFVLNPIVCMRMHHWFTVWFYAFLPLLLYLSYSAFRDIHSLKTVGFVKRSIWIALILLLMSTSIRMPDYLPFLLLAFLAGFSRPYWDYLKRSALLLGLTVVTYAAFSAVWIIPIAMGAFDANEDYLLSRWVVYFYSTNTRLLDSLSLQTPVFWGPMYLFVPISESLVPLWKACTFAVPAIAFSSLLFRRSKLIIWLALFALVFVFLGKGTNPPFGGFYDWLVFDSPVLSSFGNLFREPQKWLIPIAFCYAIMVGFTVSYLLGWIKDRIKWSILIKFLFVVIVAALLLVPLVAGYPLLSGDLGGFMKPKQLSQGTWELTSWMQGEETDYKMVDWPQTQKWGSPRPTPPRGSFFGEFVPLGYILLHDTVFRYASPSTARIGELLSAVNIGYIVVCTGCGGNVQGMVNILSQQQDVEMAGEFKHYKVYRSEPGPSLIQASEHSMIAVGGLEHLLSLTAVDAYELAEFPVVFLDQVGGGIDHISNADFVVSNLGNLDLYLAPLESEYMIRPAEAIDSNIGSKWIKASTEPIQHGYWHERVRYGMQQNWQTDYGEGLVLTSGQASMDMQFDIEDSGYYNILIRYFQSGSGSRGISVSMDGEIVEYVATESLINAFLWKDLGSFHLAGGEHTLTLKNVRGFNAVNLFAVVPHQELEGYIQQVDTMVADKRIIYIWEAESALNFSKAQSSRDYGGNASNGEVLNLTKPDSRAWRDIEVLRDDEYRLGVRLYGSATVRIDDYTIQLNSPQLDFVYLDPIYLEKGAHSIEVGAAGGQGCDLDVVWLFSTESGGETVEDIFSGDEGSVQVLEYEKLNPTKYRARVSSSEPFMLSFGETYYRLWSASVNGKEYPSVPVNSVANGFWIDDEGELEITIEYKAQRWFYWGSIISGVSLFCALAFLVVVWGRKRWQWLRNTRIGNIQNAARANVERLGRKMRSGNSVPE